MAIQIPSKTNYSFLFSNLGGSSSSTAATSNFLADYASIKNGSYGKLMKAYYSETGKAKELVSKTNTKASTSTSKDSTEDLAKIQKSTDALKESADALLSTGTKSVFAQKDISTTDENGTETTKKGYDTNAIYKAVSNFVSDYNSVIKSTEGSNTNSIANRTNGLITATAANSKLLAKVGITVNSDFTLSLDEDTFKKADMNSAKSLFSGAGSYAYRSSAQASLINFAADTEASKANTYNYNGTYNNTYSNGNLFNSFL